MIAAWLWMAGCATGPVNTPIASLAAKAGAPALFKTAMASDAATFAAGRQAAEALWEQLGGAQPHHAAVRGLLGRRVRQPGGLGRVQRRARLARDGHRVRREREIIRYSLN